MTKSRWTLERVPIMGGATGEAFVNPLQGSGMTAASVLARESIQNSTDAWLREKTDKVKVVFRRVSLVGKAKSAFIEAAGLGDDLQKRKKLLGFQPRNCLDFAGDPDEPLTLLYIEDYGTHGLYGNPRDRKSHFFRLLLSLGDAAKSRTKEDSGGSYGYGKSVYSSNSRIHTIFAYSTFNRADDGSEFHARLMGSAYLRGHEYQGVAYSGRAWFGIAEEDASQDIVAPLHNDDAHAVAQTLGFSSRSANDTGTSILIVDCGVDCEELRSSIENWWWPRLLDESIGLDVVLSDGTQTLEPPRPRSRAHLRPFIHCFEMAVKRSVPTGKHEKSQALTANNTALGDYGFSILDDDDSNDEALAQLVGKVALIRGPRMVVSYLDVGGTLPLPCVGTFVASPEIENPLRLSEPPSHDKWDPVSSRLQELDEPARQVVKTVIDRVKLAFRRFSSDAAPPTSKEEPRLKSLERLLGQIFKPPSGGGGGGGYPADPVEIKFTRQPQISPDGEGLRTSGSFRLGIADDADRDGVDVSVEVECLVVEDEGVSREDPLSVALSTSHIEHKRDEQNASRITLRLTKDVKPQFKFKTGAYPADWTARVRVCVREIK